MIVSASRSILCATKCLFSVSSLRYRHAAWGYLGLNGGFGAGLQHGEVVGEHQELQLLCLQHHLNVVLHSSRLTAHAHRNRHRWKRDTESITPPLRHTAARSVKKSINHRCILSVWSIRYWMPGILTLKAASKRGDLGTFVSSQIARANQWLATWQYDWCVCGLFLIKATIGT